MAGSEASERTRIRPAAAEASAQASAPGMAAHLLVPILLGRDCVQLCLRSHRCHLTVFHVAADSSAEVVRPIITDRSFRICV